MLGEVVTVTVDRPMGTCHPEHKNICYPINYGYVSGVMAPDGEEQDAYIIGADRPVDQFTGEVIAIVHRKDDLEDKWVVAPQGMKVSRAEIEKQVHFQEQFFDHQIIM